MLFKARKYLKIKQICSDAHSITLKLYNYNS